MTTPPLSQADAVTLLYTAVIGDQGPSRGLVRGLLPLHQTFPGPGRPAADCPHCTGTGVGAGGHCHCACDVCACGDALCDGPCESLEVMLDALVLNGTPLGAVDVPRTLARLHLSGVRRILAATLNGRTQTDTRPGPEDDPPGTVLITVSDGWRIEQIENALHAEGYSTQRLRPPHPLGIGRIRATPRD